MLHETWRFSLVFKILSVFERSLLSAVVMSVAFVVETQRQLVQQIKLLKIETRIFLILLNIRVDHFIVVVMHALIA